MRLKELKIVNEIMQIGVNSGSGGIVRVEYLVTLGAWEGLGSKMHISDVLSHILLCGESLLKENEGKIKQLLLHHETS